MLTPIAPSLSSLVFYSTLIASALTATPGFCADPLPTAAPVAGTEVLKSLKSEDAIEAVVVAPPTDADDVAVDAIADTRPTVIEESTAAAGAPSSAPGTIDEDANVSATPDAAETDRIADEYQDESIKLEGAPATPRSPQNRDDDNPAFVSKTHGLNDGPTVTSAERSTDNGLAFTTPKAGRLPKETILALQKALAAGGDVPVTVDGKFGKGTRTAILKYQKRNGLTATGDADSQTLAKLGVAR